MFNFAAANFKSTKITVETLKYFSSSFFCVKVDIIFFVLLDEFPKKF